MPTTAANLRELHALQQRAKASRDLLASGPKTLANRQAILAARRASQEEAERALLDSKAQVKKRELQLASITTKSEELRIKLNQTRKQDEYNAIVSQLNLDGKAKAKLEDEILEGMTRIEEQEAANKASKAEVEKLAAEVSALEKDIATRALDQKAQLDTLEAAIVDAEAIIPADQRDQYRRVIKQRGAEAMASVEDGACTGCFVSVTAQMTNELINGEHLVFCKSCGRILYLADADHPNLRRTPAR